MICRIKLMHEGKFVRHASAEEMKYLRVNADGKVEQLSVNHGMGICPPRFMVLRIYLDSQIGDNSFIPIYAQWRDVSDTHQVEWGIEIDGKQYYHNDIFVSMYALTSNDPKGSKWIVECDENTGSFWFISEHNREIQFSVLYPNIDEMLTVIGNINENPELLEKSNE